MLRYENKITDQSVYRGDDKKEKVATIRENFETALEINNSSISEYETRLQSVEQVQ